MTDTATMVVKTNFGVRFVISLVRRVVWTTESQRFVTDTKESVTRDALMDILEICVT